MTLSPARSSALPKADSRAGRNSPRCPPGARRLGGPPGSRASPEGVPPGPGPTSPHPHRPRRCAPCEARGSLRCRYSVRWDTGLRAQAVAARRRPRPLTAPRDARARGAKGEGGARRHLCANQPMTASGREAGHPSANSARGAGPPEPIGAGVVLNWLRSRKRCGGDVLVFAAGAG